MSSINQPKPSFDWSFYVFQLYGGDQFNWWRKPRYEEKKHQLEETGLCEKNTDLSQVTDKL